MIKTLLIELRPDKAYDVTVTSEDGTSSKAVAHDLGGLVGEPSAVFMAISKSIGMAELLLRSDEPNPTPGYVISGGVRGGKLLRPPKVDPYCPTPDPLIKRRVCGLAKGHKGPCDFIRGI